VKRLVDVDVLTGLETWHDYDAATETTLLHYHQDAQPVLDACKRDVNHSDHKLGEMAHVASVPASVQLKWFAELGVDMFNPEHKGRVRQLLDGDFKHLKRLPIQLGNYANG
jgi:hypothetical protein